MAMHYRSQGTNNLVLLAGKSTNNLDSAIENSATATFSCNHKITKRPICATPCNGIKELCEGDIDEQCQGTGLIAVLSLTFVFSSLFIAAAILTRKFTSYKQEVHQQEMLEPNQPGQANGNDILMLKNRLFILKNRLEFRNAIKLVDEFYKKTSHVSDKVDTYMMHSLGTNEHTAFFYDCIDRSLMVKSGLFVQENFPKLLQMLGQWRFQYTLKVIHCIFAMSLRYSDLTKDILFLYLIWVRLGNYSAGSFPIVIFWIVFSSIVCCEISHCLTNMMYQSSFVQRRSLNFLITPLMPAFVMFKHLQMKLNLNKLWRECDQIQKLQNDMVDKYESKCSQLKLLTAKMQCTENVLENFPLFTILIMVISLSQSKTRAVENFDNMFVEDNEFLGYMLAAISLVSMIRGQLNYLNANKNGCLGLKGTVLVIPYFVFGTCSR